jgi:hypothetical protein
MNVVDSWRNRSRNLRGEYWRCETCGARAAVRRVRCPGCGSLLRGDAKGMLPRTLRAVAFSHSHLIVETMDQRTHLKPAALLSDEEGRLFAFPLCEADAEFGAQLIGETLQLVLRRLDANLKADEAIAYGRKVAAAPATRAKLKRSRESVKGT